MSILNMWGNDDSHILIKSKGLNRHWSKESEDSVTQYYNKMRDDELARRLGVTVEALKVKAHRMGITRRRKGYHWSTNQTKYLTERYKFETAKEIAAKTGKSVRAVYNKAEQLGLKRYEHEN